MNETLRFEMRRDPSVFVMGQDVQMGTFGLTTGLSDEFGVERVRNTPIAEAGTVGVAVGAAMCGLRPFVDLHIASFVYGAMDQLVNQAAKNRFLFGGQATIPVVFHLSEFHVTHTAAQHTDRPHPMLMGVPGLKIVAPQTAADAQGLLAAAIRDDDPVVVIGDVAANSRRGIPADEGHLVPIGKADICRTGSDVTVVCFFSRHIALSAAQAVEEESISVEVIDPRTLAPLDIKTILDSVDKTGRLVVVDMAHGTCSAASEVAALVSERSFGSLRAPIARVSTPDIHIPFSRLSDDMFPSQQRIETAIRWLVSAATAN